LPVAIEAAGGFRKIRKISEIVEGFSKANEATANVFKASAAAAQLTSGFCNGARTSRNFLVTKSVTYLDISLIFAL